MKAKLSPNWRVSKVQFGPHRKQYALRVSHQGWPLHHQRPIALYFHGGAWTFGTPEVFLPAARLFIEAGYEVILPSYRRLPFYNFRHIYEDLLLMRDQLIVGRDVEVIAGMSAGGHLAAFTGWRDQFWLEAGLQVPKKMVLCGAVINLKKMNLPAGLRLLAGKPDSELFRFADPVEQLKTSRSIPAHQLLIHGTADAMVGFYQQHCYFVSQKDKILGLEQLRIDGGTHLDSCRWMYQNDEAAAKIRQLLAKK